METTRDMTATKRFFKLILPHGRTRIYVSNEYPTYARKMLMVFET